MQINHARRARPAARLCVYPKARWNVALSIGLCILLGLQSLGPVAVAQESAGSSRSQAVQPSSSADTKADVPSGKREIASVTREEDLPSAREPQPAAQAQSSSQEQQSTPNEQQKPANQQPNAQQPVGTAAAPYEKPTGVAGSRPAGAVIAPAKQRRVRAIVIKVGLLLAGGAAIGTIVGLSKASHSHP